MHQPLAEAGLDSLGALELRSALGARFGVELPATLAFDHPTIAALGAHLAAALAVAAPSDQPDAEPGAVAATVQAVISEMLGPVGPDQARLHRMLTHA